MIARFTPFPRNRIRGRNDPLPLFPYDATVAAMSAAANPARSLWEPWMAWLDYGASLGDAALRSAPTPAPQEPVVAAGAPQFQPFPVSLMDLDKVQAMGEGMLGMLSPLIVNSGALSLKLAESFWQEWMRNLRFLQDWSPLALAGPPSTWAQWPVEAVTTAMSEALQRGNYLAASTQDAADSAAAVARAADSAARHGAAAQGAHAARRNQSHTGAHAARKNGSAHAGAHPAASKGARRAARKPRRAARAR